MRWMARDRRCTTVVVVALTTMLLAAAGARGEDQPPPPTDVVTDIGRGPDYDPWQRMNRGVFWFNDHLDHYLLEPAATGWDRVMPDRVQSSIANFFANLRFPIVMVNNLLQGKVQPAVIDVGRFMINTTIGVAGFFDPATDWGLPRHNEDFGQTLGWWGVPPGPYLVLPLLGPSNPRDTGGLVVDYGLSVTPFFVGGYALMGAGAINAINARSMVLQQVKQAKQASLDYYVFVRNAYYQRRVALINDQEQNGGSTKDDLYDIDVTNDTR